MLGNGLLKIRYNNNIQLKENLSLFKYKKQNNYQSQTSNHNNSLSIIDFLGKYCKKSNSNSLPKIPKEKIPKQINKCPENIYSKDKYLYT